MTNEEAKGNLLHAIRWNCMPEKEALDGAIKALEKASALDKIRAEIEAIIGEHNLDDYDFCSGLICARKILDKYKAESEE